MFAHVRLSAGFLYSLSLFCSAECKAAGGCMKGKFVVVVVVLFWRHYWTDYLRV